MMRPSRLSRAGRIIWNPWRYPRHQARFAKIWYNFTYEEHRRGKTAQVRHGWRRQRLVHRPHPPHGDKDGRPSGPCRRMLLAHRRLARDAGALPREGGLHFRLHPERLPLRDRQGRARGRLRRHVRETPLDVPGRGHGARSPRAAQAPRPRNPLHLLRLPDGEASARPHRARRTRENRQGRARIPAGVLPQNRLLQAPRQAQRMEDEPEEVRAQLRRRGHRRAWLPLD